MLNLFPLIFLWAMGEVLHFTRGHYMDSAGWYTLAFLAASTVMAWRGRLRFSGNSTLWIVTASACVLLFTDTLAQDPLVIYASRGSPLLGTLSIVSSVARIGAVALLCSTIFFCQSRKSHWKKLFIASAALLIGCLIAGQLLVPWISPRPFIDVFVNNTRAVDFFLHGKNPYSQIYPDIYRGYYDYKPGFLYFPGLLYWLAPFRALFGDIRYGYVFANLLIALGLYGLARKLRAPEPMRWLAPLLWLSFPVVYFVLEQSWIDTVLIALAVLLLWSIEEEKWVIAGALMGAAFSVKQYGFVFGLVACLVIWRRSGIRTAVRSVVIGAAVAAAAILPFAIADWQHFYASTITAQTASAVRLDAYNATSFIAANFHWVLPGWLQAAIAAFGILLAAGFVAAQRKPSLADASLALFFGYGCAFLFGKFAFCNYHYLLAGMLLLYLVGFSSENWTAKAQRKKSETGLVPSARADISRPL